MLYSKLSIYVICEAIPRKETTNNFRTTSSTFFISLNKTRFPWIKKSSIRTNINLFQLILTDFFDFRNQFKEKFVCVCVLGVPSQIIAKLLFRYYTVDTQCYRIWFAKFFFILLRPLISTSWYPCGGLYKNPAILRGNTAPHTLYAEKFKCNNKTGINFNCIGIVLSGFHYFIHTQHHT